MAESSLFWATTGTGDGDAGGYSAADMFDLFRALFTGGSTNSGGVAPDYSDALEVTGTSTPVSVAAGAGVVYGIPYFNTAAVTVAIPTPSTSTRVDRIVLRASWAAQTVRITRIAGTEGAGAPAMTQSAGTTWDVPLATVSITVAGAITVTDGREFLQGLGDGGVSTAKLADAAITTAKIADNAVTNAKMADNAVNTAEIVANAVSLAKLATQAQATVIGRASGAGTGTPAALTAAQLITILTGADGAGSLLDADLLDGNNGLYYALYSANTPTVDPSTTTDPYIVSSHANVPGSSGLWHIITMRYSSLGRAQIAINYSSTASPAMYYRMELTGTWSAWRAVATLDGSTFTGAVGIGGAPATSALLTLTATDGALLIPRMTTTQRNALTPANGMLIYNSTDSALQSYQGGAWVSLSSVTGLPYAEAPGAWQTATLTRATAPGTGDGIFYRLNNGMVELYGQVRTSEAWSAGQSKGIASGIAAGYLPRSGWSVPIGVYVGSYTAVNADITAYLSYTGSLWLVAGTDSGGIGSGIDVAFGGTYRAEA